MPLAQRLISESDGSKCRGIDPQLFPQLPRERGLRCFTGFNLPTWKFPQARETASRRPLLHKNASRSIGQCDRDDQKQRHGTGSR